MLSTRGRCRGCYVSILFYHLYPPPSPSATAMPPFSAAINLLVRFPVSYSLAASSPTSFSQYLPITIELILFFLGRFSNFVVGASSFLSTRSPVLCFYLYLFLLHVFTYTITPHLFRSSDVSVYAQTIGQ